MDQTSTAASHTDNVSSPQTAVLVFDPPRRISVELGTTLAESLRRDREAEVGPAEAAIAPAPPPSTKRRDATPAARRPTKAEQQLIERAAQAGAKAAGHRMTRTYRPVAIEMAEAILFQPRTAKAKATLPAFAEAVRATRAADGKASKKAGKKPGRGGIPGAHHRWEEMGNGYRCKHCRSHLISKMGPRGQTVIAYRVGGKGKAVLERPACVPKK